MADSSFTDPQSVEHLFNLGTEGNRITAIALMQTDPALASARVASDALENPRSAFEQYHALRLVEAIAARQPESADAGQLRVIVDRLLRSGRFGAQNSDRCNLAARILSMIPSPETNPE